MIYLGTALIVCVVSVILAFGFTGLTFRGLPVLMYHKVTDIGAGDDLTVNTVDLERQFRYLNSKGYNSIFLSDLVSYLHENKALPPMPVLLTFDDGYQNNYTLLYPLLKQYKLKGNIFLVAGFIQSPQDAVASKSDFLHIDDIKNMSSHTVQFGLHSYDHKNYNNLTISEIEEDIRSCRNRLNDLNIPYQPCLAYTYGSFPKKDAKKRNTMFRTLEANGIQCAFRIGNRVNKLPVKNRFLIQRIDIRGNESFGLFRLFLVAGKKIFFR
jgi:hypothetical protein